MVSLQRIYAEAAHTNFPKFFANFPPNDPITVGDFGFLRYGTFERKSNVKLAFGIDTSSRGGAGGAAKLEFRWGKEVAVTSRAQAGANVSGAPVNAGLAVKFGKGGGIIFEAAGCQVSSIAEGEGFGKRIIELFDSDRWISDYVVVTSLVHADALTLLISGEEGASVEIEADATTPHVELSSIGVGLRISRESGLASKFLAARNTVPLVGLSRISRLPFFKAKFTTKYLIGSGGKQVDDYKIKSEVRAAGQAVSDVFQLEEIDDSTPSSHGM